MQQLDVTYRCSRVYIYSSSTQRLQLIQDETDQGRKVEEWRETTYWGMNIEKMLKSKRRIHQLKEDLCQKLIRAGWVSTCVMSSRDQVHPRSVRCVLKCNTQGCWNEHRPYSFDLNDADLDVNHATLLKLCSCANLLMSIDFVLNIMLQ
jgi:hypothetical protein